MKLLFVSSLYWPNIVGGAEKVVQVLAEGFVDRNHQVVVVTTHPGADVKVSELAGVKVYYLPLRNVYWPFTTDQHPAPLKLAWHAKDTYNVSMAAALGEILDREKPAIVNTHNIGGFSVAAWREVRRRRLPLAHTLHDQYLLCPKTTMFKDGRNCTKQCLDCRCFGYLRRRQSHSVDAVVGVSRFILDRHHDYGYFKRAIRRVIYNGLPAQDSSTGFTKNPSSSFRFGYLGQLRPSKGLHVLISAFMEAFQGASAELWIGGKGDAQYEVELRTRTRDACVNWLGFVRPSDFLPNIDVLVVPSLWNDTAPLVLLEAMSRGIPILGANRGGIPEFVNERVGWIFDTDDPGSLSIAMKRCVQKRDQLKSYKSAARERASEFSTSQCLDAYGDLFSSLVT